MFSLEGLKAQLPGIEFEEVDITGTIGIIIPREEIRNVARIVKEQFGFAHFIDALGVDRNQRKMRFEVIYNIRNMETKERIFLKTQCDERNPHVPSVVSIWSGANWHEREVFDMYGVIFDGHPDLRRMYMPDEFEYHPLRKDFPLMGIEGSIPLPVDKDFKVRMN
jgi:NADH-quinone oxidoreductase subunit C